MAIDFRKNANVLTAIHSFAKPNQRTASDPYVVDGYELHAHPDLAERLKSLMAYTPVATMEYVYGIPVLCAPNGRIFATVGGTHYLCLYLPEGEDWGRPYEEYGAPWRQGYAWAVGRKALPEDEDRFASLMRLSFASVLSKD
jgi:hypothetical protein